MPSAGGGRIPLGGVNTVYVSNIWQKGWNTEDFLSLILHECFHVFQYDSLQGKTGVVNKFPELNSDYSALLNLESRILHQALENNDQEKMIDLIHMFISVRHKRWEKLSQETISNEGKFEYSEGTATYI